MPAVRPDFASAESSPHFALDRGVVVRRRANPPGQVMPPHAHPFATLTLVMGGGFSDEYESGTAEGAPLSVAFKPSGHPHATSVRGHGMRSLVIEIGPAIERRLRACGALLHGCGVSTDPLIITRMVRVALTTLDSPGPQGEHAVDQALAALTQRARGPMPAQPKGAAARALKLLELEHAESTGTGSIAAELGLHPTSVTRMFRRSLGCGVMEHLRRLRVRAAAERLANSALPLALVACEAGFADQAHMTRCFRRETGVTPGLYRRLAGGQIPVTVA
ncbi:MAG TPA: hypothetical protein DEB06_10035 [Phycisphaerales bacterium]|nr:hypothetical protein [Phycisphaerales bacterium]